MYLMLIFRLDEVNFKKSKIMGGGSFDYSKSKTRDCTELFVKD